MKSKRQSKNADQINREEQIEAGENNKGDERLPETEEHYVNAMQMGGLI